LVSKSACQRSASASRSSAAGRCDAARVVDQRAHARACAEAVGQRGDGLRVGEVDREGADARRAELRVEGGGRRVEDVRPAAEDADLVAVGGQGAGDGPPDAGAAAGDDRDGGHGADNRSRVRV
jgi:hypothetical protein